MAICTVCSQKFDSKQPKLVKYCSNKCRNISRLLSTSPSICPRPDCKKEFKTLDKRQKFCSSSCSATFHNPRTKRKPRKFVDCRLCDTKLLKSQEQFCSHECRVSCQAFDRYNLWVDGYVDASDATGELKSWARTILLEMCDYTCECGWNTINPTVGKPILTVDHIDGNWTNNYCWNLKVLCYNCHTLTPTFGSLNRGSKSGRRNYNITRNARIV